MVRPRPDTLSEPSSLARSSAGLTLIEALVSLFVLLIGVTAVISLFPVGIQQVRQAMLDTRCTILAESAWAIVDSLGADYTASSIPGAGTLLIDPVHLRPSVGSFPIENFLSSSSGGPISLPTTFYPIATSNASYHVTLMTYTGAGNSPPSPTFPAVPLPDPNITVTPPIGGTPGVPILIDPLWVEFESQRAAVYPADMTALGWNDNRQTAVGFGPLTLIPGGNFTPGNLGYTPAPLRVASVWTALSIVDSILPVPSRQREAFIRRWFTSSDELDYRPQGAAGLPFCPANQLTTSANVNSPYGTGEPTIYPLAPDALTPNLERRTAGRSYNYSWALMVQANVVGSSINYNAPAKQALLCFYKRNLSAPARVALGAFVNGDTRVTLRYPNGQKPNIRRGTWVCEVTIANNLATTPWAGLIPAGPSQSRSFSFHRVSDYVEGDDTAAGGGPYYVLTLEKAPSNFNAGTRGAGAPANYFNTSNQPVPDRPPNFTPPGTSTNTPIYSPVIVFDGLQEVYDRAGLWGN